MTDENVLLQDQVAREPVRVEEIRYRIRINTWLGVSHLRSNRSGGADSNPLNKGTYNERRFRWDVNTPHMFQNRSKFENEQGKGKEHNTAENFTPYAPGATPGNRRKNRAQPYPPADSVTVRGKTFERGTHKGKLRQSRFKPGQATTTPKKGGPGKGPILGDSSDTSGSSPSRSSKGKGGKGKKERWWNNDGPYYQWNGEGEYYYWDSRSEQYRPWYR